MIITDSFTKWVEIVAIPNKEAETVASGFYYKWICRFSAPHTVISDQGSEFTAKIFRNLNDLFHIQQNFSSAMHPQSNGQVERFNRTMLAYIRKFLPANQHWDSLLPALQCAYNTIPHSTTKFSPFQLLHGRLPNIPASLFAPLTPYYGEDESVVLFKQLAYIYRQVFQNQKQAFLDMKRHYDKKSRVKDISAGDIVFVTRPHKGDIFQKFQKLYEGPFRVISISSKNNLQLQNLKTLKLSIVHINRVKLAPYVKQMFDIKENEKNKADNQDKKIEEKGKSNPENKAKKNRNRKKEEVVEEKMEDDQMEDKAFELNVPKEKETEEESESEEEDDNGNIFPGDEREMTRDEVLRYPGRLTRLGMRIMGYRIPQDISIPSRPIEYKTYERKD
jgi:hypothetical protein